MWFLVVGCEVNGKEKKDSRDGKKKEEERATGKEKGEEAKRASDKGKMLNG